MNQLVLYRRRRGDNPIVTPNVATTEPILVLSSDLEGSNNLAFLKEVNQLDF